MNLLELEEKKLYQSPEGTKVRLKDKKLVDALTGQVLTGMPMDGYRLISDSDITLLDLYQTWQTGTPETSPRALEKIILRLIQHAEPKLTPESAPESEIVEKELDKE